MEHYIACLVRSKSASETPLKNNKITVLLHILFQTLQYKVPKKVWLMIADMVFDKKRIENNISQADLFIERVMIYHKYYRGVKWVLPPSFTDSERKIFYSDINRLKDYYDLELDESVQCPYTQTLGRLSDNSWGKTWGIGIDYMGATFEVVAEALNDSCYLLNNRRRRFAPRKVSEYTWDSYHMISPMYVEKRIKWLIDAIEELKCQLNVNSSYWNRI